MQTRVMSVLLGFCVFAAAQARAGNEDAAAQPAEAAQIIRQAKSSLALIRTTQKAGFGAAFCIDPTGVFATNSEVAAGPPGREVELVFDPDDPTPKRITARVVRADTATRVTLLQAAVANHPFLPLGDSENLIETSPVTAVGYPRRKPVIDENPYLSPTVTAARINSLRKTDGRLRMIMIGIERGNGGNTFGVGGPLIDAQGRVIGIMDDSGSSRFARPVSDLKKLLDKPLLGFSPAAIDEQDSRKPREFAVSVLTSGGPSPDWTVELEFQAEGGDARKFAAERDPDGRYRATAALLPAQPGTAEVRIHAVFAEGELRGRVKDVEVQVGDESVWLSRIQRVEAGPDGEPPTVSLDNETRREKLSELKTIAVRLGGSSVEIDLSLARRIDLEPIFNSPAHVSYRVTLREKDDVLAEAAGRIPIARATPAETTDQAKLAGDPDKPAPEAPASKPFQSEVLELTEKTPAHWTLREARAGTLLWTDATSALTSLPEEMIGGTLVCHDAGRSGWLPAGVIRATKDCSVYAIVRASQNGKVDIDDVMRVKFAREGWEEVDDAVRTGTDDANRTSWITLRRRVEAGDVILQLENIVFGNRIAAFVFQELTAARLAADKQAPPADERKRRLPKGAFRSDVVELTDAANPDWIFKEARSGTPIESDKNYLLAKLPKELVGGTLLWRSSGSRGWLPADAVRAQKDCKAWAVVRWKYLGKTEIDEVAFQKLAREGWKEAGEVKTTFPEGEDWRWKALEKDVSAGDVVLQLETVSWGNQAVFFIFK